MKSKASKASKASEVSEVSKASTPATKAIAKPKAAVPDRKTLLVRANNGDAAAVKELFESVKGTPEEAGIVDVLADVSARSAAKLAGTLGKGPLYTEAFGRKIASMRNELSGPAPAPLERLLVERIINCWLQVHQLEILLNIQDTQNVRAIEYFDRRLDKAHKRYLASIKALAQVRKLQLPTVQVNIGEKQINVANGA